MDRTTLAKNGDLKNRKNHVTLGLTSRGLDPILERNPLLMSNTLQVPEMNGHKKPISREPEVAVEVEEFTPPDGGWGWLVCFASFWVNGTVFGMLNTFGILLPKFSALGAEKDNITTKVSLIASITLFMTFFMSMISSIAADQLGIRKVGVIGGLLSFIGLLSSSFVQRIEILYLTYGVLFGIGSSFIYSGSLVILGHYFRKRMALVNGIVTTGSAIFTIALPYLLKYLLDTRGLAFTLQVESGLVATTIICALIFKPLIKHKPQPKLPVEEVNRRTRSFLSSESIHQAYADVTTKFSSCFAFVKRYLNVDIWKNRGYVIWAVGITFSLFGYFIPLVHINNYVKTAFPDRDGEILIMTIGGVSGIGRLVSGKLGDMKCVNRILFQQVAFVIYGITTLVIPFVHIFEVLIGLCLILGVMDGCFICLLGPIAFDIVGPQNASQAMGFLLAMVSIPLMIGPMIGGWIFDATSKYDYAFYFAGVPPLIGAAIMFFIPKITPREEEEGNQAEVLASISISHWSLYDGAPPGRKSRGQSMLALPTQQAAPQEFDDVVRVKLDRIQSDDGTLRSAPDIKYNGNNNDLSTSNAV